jgi:uncharacterized protein
MTNYTNQITTLTNSARSIIAIITKVQTQLESKNLIDSQVVEGRLAPDMFPLCKQIQIISDNLKGGVGRITGSEVPKYEDTESTLDDLKVRLTKTLEFIAGVDQSKFNNVDENSKITLPYMPGMYMTMNEYVNNYWISNTYFHIVTAYAIIRHLGFDLAKMDYIGGLNLKPEEV